MKTLAQAQEEGARFLAQQKRAFLGDDPGVIGKTLQAIRACDHIGARHVLVICPPSVTVNWQREFDDSSLLDPEVSIYTPGSVANARLRESYDAIILDEAHYYKTPNSGRTKLVYGPKTEGDGIVERAPYVFLLSGSPAPNNPGELWTHLHALRPELIPGPTGNPMGHQRFQQVYCQIKQTPFGPKIMGVRPSKVDALKAILSQFMLRRTEGDVELPPLSVSPFYVSAKVTRLDGSEDAQRVRAALETGGLDALKGLTSELATLRRLIGLAKVEPTLAYAEEWLKNNPGKLCIYAWHTEVLEAFKTFFGATCAMITGSTRDRQAEVDKFQTNDDCRVFIGQIQAAGEAITLTKATEILIVEPSWVPKDNYQVIKRIHRIGQTQPCHARFITISGSIDDAINRVLVRKEAMISTVLDGV